MCNSRNDIILEEIEGITETHLCQFNCNIIYAETCKYFVHDVKLQICKLYNTKDIGSCRITAGGTPTDIVHCEQAFDDEKEEISCLVVYNIKK